MTLNLSKEEEANEVCMTGKEAREINKKIIKISGKLISKSFVFCAVIFMH